MTQPPPDPQPNQRGPYLQQPPPGYIPVKSGPSCGKVFLIMLAIGIVVLAGLFFLQVT